jgi:thiamine biosynthesis lipoprotein
MRPACDSVHRARPLLGTFVEITATGRPAAALHAAIDAAFAAVARVHRLMSFQESTSDVSRVNRHAATTAVEVHPWTYAVLTTAADLFRRSDGLFDVTVAPELQALGVLPRAADETPITTRPRADGAIELLSGHRVRCGEAGIRIDLSGIAKGFAVDRAIDVLRDAGLPGGLVNAGGDLVSFGPDGHRVHLRDPRDQRRVLGTAMVKDAAWPQPAAASIRSSASALTGRRSSILGAPPPPRGSSASPCARRRAPWPMRSPRWS